MIHFIDYISKNINMLNKIAKVMLLANFQTAAVGAAADISAPAAASTTTVVLLTAPAMY